MNNLSLVAHINGNIEKLSSKPAYFKKVDDTWKAFSWKAFGDDIYKVSRALLNSGVDVQEKVGIFSQNLAQWTITDLAAVSIRAVVVPIYSTNSKNELAYVINDAQIKVLFVGDQNQYDKAASLLNQVNSLERIIAFKKDIQIDTSKNSVYFDDFKNEQFTNEAELTVKVKERQDTIEGKDLATIIYTSGTTGEPKGVMLDHKNIADTIEAHVLEEKLPLGNNETSLSFLPLSHIFERAWVLFCVRSAVPIYFNEDPKLIVDVIKEVKPTLMCTVPRLFEKIYSSIQDAKAEASPIKRKLMDWSITVGDAYYNEYIRLQKPVPSLFNLKFKIADKLVLSKIKEALGGNIKIMPCGGAPLSVEIFRFFHALGVNVKLGYGLTETSATSTLSADKNINFKSSGKTLHGTEIKIGPNNEIFVKGGGVMRGYYNKPEETAKVFEDGWFKTGDAGKIDVNGNLIITDRIKDLIKTSGGKYVAPQKLESSLINDSFIEQIAIIGEKRKFISALIVPSVEVVKHFCQHHGLTFKNMEESIKLPEIIHQVEANVKERLKDFSPHEQIKKITLLGKEFTMEAGELTPTLKIKRKVIAKKYKALIDAMYA
ncbi:MAG: long-chain acyl-CoA synthetase [Planctomycetota bacterium]|jgi:long-chain acyl-CoA synthetase